MREKDYELIAGVIAKDVEFYGRPDGSNVSGEAVKSLANWLAEAFEADNPKFDRQKFLTACGIEQESDPDDPDFMLEQLERAGQLDDLLKG